MWAFCLLLTDISAQIAINEIVSSNKESLIIGNKSPDWIELYNSSSTDINLIGWQISDNENQPDKYTFPSFVIKSNEYAVILADGLGTEDEYLHLNFKISAAGEKLILRSDEGVQVQLIDVPSLEEDISFAFLDGDWIYASPTPGSPNGQQFGKLDSPTADFASGIYSSDITVNFTHPDEDVSLLLFEKNLDHRTATSSSSLALVIDTTTTVCVGASKMGALDSDLICRTFILDRDHKLPVISISASHEALFDSINGMFELGPDAKEDWPYWGANFWNDLSSEAYFEFFNNEGKSSFAGHGDIEMHGGRESRTQIQKSFRLLAKQKYQQAYFHYPFFRAKPDIDRFKRIVLRNSSGDFGAAHCRDGFLQSFLMSEGLDLDATAYEPVAVYINGEYYGMMGIREKMDKFYPDSNYDQKDVDLLEQDRLVLAGDSLKFIDDFDFLLNHDLSDPVNYEKASQLFDVRNLIDYFHAQIGNVSTAWPQNNIKYWRPRNIDGKWRFLLFDMDIALGRHKWTSASQNALEDKLLKYKNNNTFIQIIYAFLQNQEFHDLFMNRHQDLFNTSFESARTTAAFQDFLQTIDHEMQNHFDRWTKYSYGDWSMEHTVRVSEFLQERPSYASMHMNEFFKLGGTYLLSVNSNDVNAGYLALNTIDSLHENFEGLYFKKVPILLRAIAHEGYYFDYWEVDGEKYYTTTLNKIFSSDTDVTAYFTTVQPEDFVQNTVIKDKLLSITLNNTSAENITLEVFSLDGRMIRRKSFENFNLSTHIIELPLDNLVNGTYIVKINQGEKQSIQKIISIQ